MALLVTHIAKREGISVMVLEPVDTVALAMRASMGRALIMGHRMKPWEPGKPCHIAAKWRPIDGTYAASLVQGRDPIW